MDFINNNKRKNYMIKSIKNDIYFLKYMFLYSKSYVIGEALVAVIEGLIPLIDIIIPKMLIDSLYSYLYYSSISKFIFFCFYY